MRKLSKKLVAACMTAAMMLTMVPAAFAAEPETTTARPAPEEVLEATSVQNASTNGISTLANSDETYLPEGAVVENITIDSKQDFQNLMDECTSTSGMTYKNVTIADDLDLTGISISQWNGYLMYFWGNITGQTADGHVPTITGLAADTYLIYGWFGGTISNLNFDMNGKAATINYICGKMNGDFRDFTMKDITVLSTENGSDTPIVLPTDNQANYAPFTYSMYGEFTMNNCVNKADINGNTYASIYCGYYPLDTTGTYTFENCVNEGTVSLRHAGMFFGNNTGFKNAAGQAAFAFNQTDPSQNRIQFSGCANDGTIKGTESAGLFSGRPAGQDDTVSCAYENYLRTNTQACARPGTVSVIENDLNMTLTYDEQGNLSMTKATNAPAGYTIDHYVVSVYTYVKSYAQQGFGDFIDNGTDRYGASQTISSNVDNPQVSVKYYGVTDNPEAELTDQYIDGIQIATLNGKNYYWVDNFVPYISDGTYDYYPFVSSTENSGTIDVPSFATLTAYTADGTMLGSVSATSANNNEVGV